MNRPSPFTAAMAVLLTVLLGCASTAGAGLNLVSLDQEWGMRNDLRAQVSQQARVVDSSYLNTVGRRIASQTPLGNRRWDFAIVQDSSVNAFNLPGGLVYVHSGLIAEADTLAELAGVLAHEIGHGSARHGTQLMTRAYGYNAIAGLLLGRNPSQGKQIAAQLLGTGILTNYSREAEREADRLGVHYTYQAGYDPQGMIGFYGEMLDMRQSRPNKVQQLFSTHPLTDERIRNIQAEASKLPRRSSLTNDTNNFQNFRSQFR
ncbi:MAG TPA: M48 family metallopeptidase [Thermoanaerobaculia bacterium]|nr:M48 family metallopeptidase [Thermoanaerobaculia bacterium]